MFLRGWYCTFVAYISLLCTTFSCSAILPVSRRHAVVFGIVGSWVLPIQPPAHAETANTIATPTTPGSMPVFRSAGYGREEYTNSIVASRDTNISPAEVYDTLAKLKGSSSSTTQHNNGIRALDVGAGAGVSTQVLWELGYREIDAVDWSGTAWRLNVVENGSCPPTVHFFELDDERFLKQWQQQQQQNQQENTSARYDAIVFNFAVNRRKAVYFAKELLKDGGILLAPINTQNDYWFKQIYTLMDSSGKTLWVANDVGAWSVLFQPDVTQDTCQGIWCAPFNGFQKP